MLVLIMSALVAVALAVGGFECWLWSRGTFGGGRAAPGHDGDGDGGGGDGGGGGGDGDGDGDGEQRNLSLLTESLAYVGVLLILSGGFIVTQQRWLHITNSERVVMLSAVALVMLAAGFVVRWAITSRKHRLTEVLWLSSVASAAGATAIAVAGGYGQDASVTALAVSAMVAPYSAVLWFLCRRELLMVVAFAGLVGTLCSGIIVGVGSTPPWLAISLGLLLFGTAWVILGWLYPQPLGTSVTVGAALALAAPAIAVHDVGWVYAIGIMVAATAMAVSIPMRNIIILAFGSCALFAYITATVIRYAGRSLDIAEILILVGGLLIGLALVTVGLSRATRASPA